jgi:hypothetical protein
MVDRISNKLLILLFAEIIGVLSYILIYLTSVDGDVGFIAVCTVLCVEVTLNRMSISTIDVLIKALSGSERNVRSLVALNLSLDNIIGIIAPLFAIFIYQKNGMFSVIFVNIVSYIPSIMIILYWMKFNDLVKFFPVQEKKWEPMAISTFTRIICQILRSERLRGIVVITMSINILWSIIPIYLASSARNMMDSSIYPLALSSLNIGAVAMGLLSSMMNIPHIKRWGMVFTVFALFVLAVISATYADTVFFKTLLFFGVGVLGSWLAISMGAMLINDSPQERLGSISATTASLGHMLTPLLLPVFGLLCSMWQAKYAYVFICLCMFTTVTIYFVFSLKKQIITVLQNA